MFEKKWIISPRDPGKNRKSFKAPLRKWFWKLTPAEMFIFFTPVHHSLTLTDCHPKNTLKSHYSGGKEEQILKVKLPKMPTNLLQKKKLLCFCVESISEFLPRVLWAKQKHEKMARILRYRVRHSQLNGELKNSIKHIFENVLSTTIQTGLHWDVFSISLIRMCYIYSCVKILQILPKQCNSGSCRLIFRSLSQRIITIFPLISIFKPHWCFQVLFLASLLRCRFIDLEVSIQSSQQLSFATMSSSSNRSVQ